MQDTNNLVITDTGRELMARLLSGIASAKFTKICTSDFDYSTSELKSLTELGNIKQTVSVSVVEKLDAATVEVKGAFNNTALGEGYYVRGIGLYAQDGEDEILYGVAVSEKPCYFPKSTGKTVSGINIMFEVAVSNSEQVIIEMNPDGVSYIEFNRHIENRIDNAEGIHGIRYYNDALQFFNGSEWIDISSGGGGVAPSNIIEPKISAKNGKLILKWSDPGDTVVDGQTICTWVGTKLVQKEGSFPENIKDGIVLIDNQVKDAYSTNGFEITGLTNETTYYFQLFPYSDQKAINNNAANRLSGVPYPYKVMTAQIDLTNSNPATCVAYSDDAVDVVSGSNIWDEFLGHRPCLFKDGLLIGYLNPNDFTKFENGTAADITSGVAGDVMIEFPRRGLVINTVGNIVTISMTDNPADGDFEYLAHVRGETRRDNFYIGAYAGFTVNSILRSLSGKMPSVSQTITTFRNQAQARTGYEQLGFYQLTFIQCAYILKYKNLNSQAAIGKGYVENTVATSTGNTNLRGMDWGEQTGKYQMKLFGIEDLWGNVWKMIDGLWMEKSGNVLASTTGFNDNGTGYTYTQLKYERNVFAYMKKPQGTTKLGFLMLENGATTETYFCDSNPVVIPNQSNDYGAYLLHGSTWSGASEAGIFYSSLNGYLTAALTNTGARLMYL